MTAGLLPDLRAGARVMSANIAGFAELIGTKGITLECDALCFCLDEFQVGAADLTDLRSRVLIDEHDLGAECRHHAGAFFRVATRHHGNECIAFGRAHDRETGSHIAAGEFHDGLPRLQTAISLRVFNDLACRTVFLGKSRVEHFEFREYTTGVLASDSVKGNQWCIADRLACRFRNHGVRPTSESYELNSVLQMLRWFLVDRLE